ncbi:MAG: glycyl-radical enzyme activating protein [Clostridia bacterium]|nr:glycyl-radical enzyme activating protein [Clostridia bacterium]
MRTYILDLQKMSTEDGPGIRTTVFFKGCNLKCAWCHNPESIAFYRHIYWLEERCMGCQSCVSICPKKAITSENGIISIDARLCDFCMKCVEECPMNAIEVKGMETSVEELVKELMKDKAFYDASGGGVTLSGGEAVLNWEYLLPLLQQLKQRGVHTAVDTAGCYPFPILQKLLPYTDLILYDLKHIDNVLHNEFTGVENTLIFQNAARLGKLKSPKVWIRTPIIPGATDTKENIIGIAKFIKENMPDIERWELISFNNLAGQKYKLLGKEWQYKDVELLTRTKMESLCALAKKQVKKAMWSGATKSEVTL